MASTISPIDGALDPSDPTPLHEQVAAQLRRAIAEGQAKPGERLPPAADLAAVMRVNRNTVLRALHLLREEGLLEFRRGRGITVAGTPQRSAILTQTRELVAFARQHGYRRDDLIEIIQALP
jgi:GntR family transcriptional regulator